MGEPDATSGQPIIAARQPMVPQEEVGRALQWSGRGAWFVGCGVPLATGLAAGWPLWRAGSYALLALAALALVESGRLPPRLCAWLGAPGPRFLLLWGAVGLALQALSGDPFVQPMVLCVPLVYAALNLRPARTAALGALYLGLTALGLWLAGQRAPEGLLFPVVAYGALMLLLEAFVRVSLAQAAARARAADLAADLARERDALARLAAENARLAEQARASATLAERNRLARELHDTIAQGLTAVTMQIEAAQRAMDRDPPRARARLARAHELARGTLDDVRRSVWTLADPPVDAAGLPDVLAALARRFEERTGTTAAFQHTGGAPALDAGAATQLLRVAQEALQNVEKHARASLVELELAADESGARLRVRDDGAGFEPDAAGLGGGFGLVSLRERARLAGGALAVESAPGRGTCVTVTVPPAGAEREA